MLSFTLIPWTRAFSGQKIWLWCRRQSLSAPPRLKLNLLLPHENFCLSRSITLRLTTVTFDLLSPCRFLRCIVGAVTADGTCWLSFRTIEVCSAVPLLPSSWNRYRNLRSRTSTMSNGFLKSVFHHCSFSPLAVGSAVADKTGQLDGNAARPCSQ